MKPRAKIDVKEMEHDKMVPLVNNDNLHRHGVGRVVYSLRSSPSTALFDVADQFDLRLSQALGRLILTSARTLPPLQFSIPYIPLSSRKL